MDLKLIKGKKGILFTLMAIALSGLFIILFSAYTEKPIDAKTDLVNARVISLNDYLEHGFEYSAQSLEQAGYKSLEALYIKINNSSPREYLGRGNFEEIFRLCTLNGSNCTNPQNNLEFIMNNYSVTLTTKSKIQNKIKVLDVSILQEQPFLLEVQAKINIVLNDTYAYFNTTKNVKTRIKIDGINDPTYLNITDSLGSVLEERKIIPRNFAPWDLKEFSRIFYGKKYFAWSAAPCLSDKFEGNFSEKNSQNSQCGFASIVDTKDHPNLILPSNLNITHLDYQVASESRYPCNTSSPQFETSRVNIKAINKELILTTNDATFFNLDNNSIWYYDELTNETSANGCLGWS